MFFVNFTISVCVCRYRLAPEVHFPVQYEDCLAAAKHFLEPGILGKLSVDPQRVAVSGDSAGGNLAAAVAQQISVDDSVSVKFSVQALIYPVLQGLDLNTPSHQQNHNIPMLHRFMMARYTHVHVHTHRRTQSHTHLC